MLKLLKFDQSHSGLSTVRILRKVDVDKKPGLNKNPDSSRLAHRDGNDQARFPIKQSKSLRACLCRQAGEAMSPHKPKLSWNNIVQILLPMNRAQDDSSRTPIREERSGLRDSTNILRLLLPSRMLSGSGSQILSPSTPHQVT